MAIDLGLEGWVQERKSNLSLALSRIEGGLELELELALDSD